MRLILKAISIMLLAIAGVGMSATAQARPVMLARDTVWSGEVTVEDRISVDAGVTLRIEPGTVVRFAVSSGGSRRNGAALRIHGTLIAEGTASEPIRFTSAESAPTPGDWEGIRFQETRGAPSRLRHCLVEYASQGISGTVAQLDIEFCRLERNVTGMVVEGKLAGVVAATHFGDNQTGIRYEQGNDLTIKDSTVTANLKAGIVCNGASPEIRGNDIAQNGRYGVGCFYSASPLVENNLISGHVYGVYAEKKSRPVIRHNDIVGNDTGIGLQKMVFPHVEANRIEENRVGLYSNLSAYPLLRGNNIRGNRHYAFELGPKHSLSVNANGPFAERDWAFAAAAGPLKLRKNDRSQEFSSAFPTAGRLDVRHNWWGEEALGEMSAAGDEANLKIFEDGYDNPVSEFRGKTYPRDRIAYAPWATAPCPGAGRLPRGEEKSPPGEVWRPVAE